MTIFVESAKGIDIPDLLEEQKFLINEKCYKITEIGFTSPSMEKLDAGAKKWEKISAGYEYRFELLPTRKVKNAINDFIGYIKQYERKN